MKSYPDQERPGAEMRSMLREDRLHRTPAGVADVLQAVVPDRIQTAKEIVRHGLLRSGTIGVLDAVRKLKGFRTIDYLHADAAETFSRTYSSGGWVHEEQQESRSGRGSSAAATSGLLARIGEVMDSFDCRSLVDIGCGDWNWMSRQDFGFDYTGVDIVSEVIEENVRKWSRENVRFAVCNAIVQEPPSADLALCREVLFHLSLKDAAAVIRNAGHATRFLCATTDLDIGFNSDIRTGDYRKLNLMRSPFNLPAPVCLITDNALSNGRYLGVWPANVVC